MTSRRSWLLFGLTVVSLVSRAEESKDTACRAELATVGDPDTVEVELIGKDLPLAPPAPLRLGVSYALEFDGANRSGSGKTRFFWIVAWRFALRTCGRTRVSLREGPWRFKSQELTPGARVQISLEPAPPTLPFLLVARKADGQPAPQLSFRLSGCSEAVTDDEGKAWVDCEDRRFRKLTVGAPWQLVPRGQRAADIAGTAATFAVTVEREPVRPGQIGLSLGATQAGVLISDVALASPALHAGLRPGDLVLEVDGVTTATVAEARQRIVGAPGTSVRLTISRANVRSEVEVVRVKLSAR